jgi:hypothetical protein
LIAPSVFTTVYFNNIPKPKRQSRMDNPEKAEGTIKNGQSRENRRGNQEWTIQRNWQHKTKSNKNKIKPHTHSTICAGHHSAETIIVQTTGGKHWL